ncbi:hypothetical protein N836_00425 [Leptolyngbya sp. Heron Island J]|nr:hypothetical protein N836_00425 [Leptolyngbya sp. Heron Island J]
MALREDSVQRHDLMGDEPVSPEQKPDLYKITAMIIKNN